MGAVRNWLNRNWKLAASVLTVVVILTVVAFLVVPLVVKMVSAEAPESEKEVPTPVACPADSVRIEAAVPAASGAGGPVTVELSLTTTSALPCLVQAGPESLGMVITSGQETVINTLSCASADAPTKQLLLKNPDVWKGSLSWDGVIRGEGCAPGEAARPGTYVVQLLLGNEKVGDQHVLVLE